MAEELADAGTTPMETPAGGERSEPAPERPADVPASDDTFDINSVPEALRPQAQALEKQFRNQYLTKTQSLKSQLDTLDQYKKNEALLGQQMKDLFADPNPSKEKYEQYRKMYAPLLGIDVNQEAQAQKQFETVEEIISEVEKKAEAKAAQKTQEVLTLNERKTRWDTALNEMRGKEPIFAEFETELTQVALSPYQPKYREMYRGNNEAEVLRAVTDDFKKRLVKRLDAVKQESLETVSKKASGTTQIPSAGKTTVSGAKPSKQDIINEWRSKAAR